MKIQLAALAAVMSVALLAPFGAQGSTHVQYGVQDDAWLLYGPEAPAKRIEILQQLGVDIVRLTLRWDAVAQSSPDRRSQSGRSCVSLGSVRPDPAAAACCAHRRAHLSMGHPALGERRTATEFHAE